MSAHIEASPLKAYIIGFILSILLTLGAYLLVSEHLLSGMNLIWAVVGLGLIQAFVQLVFFFHLGAEEKPRWNLVALLFMGMVVVILVFGSLWIMWSLNYRMMPSMDMKTSTMQGME